MRCTVEKLLILACVVLALPSDSHTCEGEQRPHPRGLCGRRLAQAHSNLCFLLREVYHREHYHRPRRSPRLDAGAAGLVQKVYSIPLDVLAELDFTKDDWHILLNKKSVNNYDFPKEELSEDALMAAPVATKPFQHHMNAFTRRIVRRLRQGAPVELRTPSDADSAMHPRSKRSLGPSSNMVCDCCYNRCLPEELGTYC